MRTLAISLISLAFAVSGAGFAAAQDEPITTAPSEVTIPAPTQLDFTTPRTEVRAETTTSAAVLEDVQREAEQRRTGARLIMELSDGAAIVSQRVGASEAGGGLLRANPDLNRRDRKALGFAFKF